MFQGPTTWLLLLTTLFTATAAVWDLRTGLIPNRLVGSGAIAVTALIIAFAIPQGIVATAAALLLMVAGAAIAAIVPALLYRLDGIGGGDVKLLALVGAALGPYMGLEAELYAFASILFYAPLRLSLDGSLRKTLHNAGQLLLRPLLRTEQRPALNTTEMTSFRFGPAIFVGTLAVTSLHLWNAA